MVETLKQRIFIEKHSHNIPVYIQQGLTGVLNIYKSVLILSGMLLYIVMKRTIYCSNIFIFLLSFTF